MNLTQRISKYPLEYVRSKRKKRYWLLIWLVSTFAACDVLLLFLLTKVFLPHLLSNTPYLLPEQAQEYTHLSTFTPSPERSVNMLAFTPDGKTLACVVYNDIILWDVKTDIPLYTIKEPEGVVTALAFAPDGKTLAISNQSKRNSVILYDTATGHLKTYLTGHTSWIATLDFSSDGKTLVGANSDGLIGTNHTYSSPRCSAIHVFRGTSASVGCHHPLISTPSPNNWRRIGSHFSRISSGIRL